MILAQYEILAACITVAGTVIAAIVGAYFTGVFQRIGRSRTLSRQERARRHEQTTPDEPTRNCNEPHTEPVGQNAEPPVFQTEFSAPIYRTEYRTERPLEQ